MAEKIKLHESWERVLAEHAQQTRPEELRETVRERIEQARRKPPAPVTPQEPPPVAPSARPPQVKAADLRDLEESRQLSFLAHMALEQGVEPAVELAKRIGSPFVIDALHDFIIDRLLAVLAKRKAARHSS